MQANKRKPPGAFVRHRGVSFKKAYGQSTSGLNGANNPLGLGLPSQTCRLQCAAGIGVPPTLNGSPPNVGAGWPVLITMYSTPSNFIFPFLSGAYSNASGFRASNTGSTRSSLTQ